jgi:O-antigen/teichoic acid export membrane protein
MSQRVAAADRAGLAAVMHRTAQQVALALLPAAATLAAFAQPVLSAWLGRSSPLVAPVAFLLPWCLAGVAINALVSVPFLMELAHGRTGRVIRVNMVAAPLFALACWLGVPRYGAAFAAGAFIAVNVGYVLVMVPMIFASALPGQYGRWLWRGVLLPGALSILVAIAGRALVPEAASLMAQLAASGLTGLCGLAACLLVLPEARDTAATLYRRLRRRLDPAAR